MELKRRVKVAGILDSGSQVTLMTKRAWEATKSPLNPGKRMLMQEANGELKSTIGAVKNMPIRAGEVTTHAHIHVIEDVAVQPPSRPAMVPSGTQHLNQQSRRGGSRA